MLTELKVAGIALVVLVFLSTVESAYESLSEVSLRLMISEREASRRARFFRELLENRRRFELILILGTQLSIAAIAMLIAIALSETRLTATLAITLVTVFLVIVLFRQLIPHPQMRIKVLPAPATVSDFKYIDSVCPVGKQFVQNLLGVRSASRIRTGTEHMVV